MTTTQLVPIRTVGPGEVHHPGWCSPDHCRADRIGKTHESAPVEVAGVTIGVTQAVMTSEHPPTHAVVTIETDPQDNDGPAVMLRLGEVPAFTKALLAFYCQQQ